MLGSGYMCWVETVVVNRRFYAPYQGNIIQKKDVLFIGTMDAPLSTLLSLEVIKI